MKRLAMRSVWRTATPRLVLELTRMYARDCARRRSWNCVTVLPVQGPKPTNYKPWMGTTKVIPCYVWLPGRFFRSMQKPQGRFVLNGFVFGQQARDTQVLRFVTGYDFSRTVRDTFISRL